MRRTRTTTTSSRSRRTAASRALQAEPGLDEAAADQIARYLAAARDALGLVPTQEDLVFERFFKRELDIADPAAVGAVLAEAGADVIVLSKAPLDRTNTSWAQGGVAGVFEGAADTVEEWSRLLFDQALVAEGSPPSDPAGMARRITTLLTRSIG